MTLSKNFLSFKLAPSAVSVFYYSNHAHWLNLDPSSTDKSSGWLFAARL
jgi:hypothetical protein